MLYGELADFCLKQFSGDRLTPVGLADAMMALPSVPMHGPVHHYIVPAALLTCAAKINGLDAGKLKQQLHLSMERAEKVLPGFCGFWGCCGSAVGCGIFASVLLEVSPMQEHNWAVINAFTSKCLSRVASVDGPRCCKRVTYLSLLEAIRQAPSMLGVDFGLSERPACRRFNDNKECKKEICPFFPMSA